MRFKTMWGITVAAALGACSDFVTPKVPTTGGSAMLSETPNGAVTWTRQLTGSTDDGSQWAIFVPRGWNGDVVYYAHGIVDAALPVSLPTSAIAELRDSLGLAGYAVAYSSFSQNGWAVKDGILKTRLLREVFQSRVSRPRHSYLAGHSMGGLIALSIAEKFPNQYDGALPMCGVVAGAQYQVNYVGNVRTIFDYFYPGVLPANAVDIKPDLNLNTQVLGPAQFALVSNPTGAGAMARIDQIPLPFASGPELIQSILTAIAFDARGADDLVDRVHGHSPFDNSETVYTGALPAPLLADLNARIMRFTEPRDAERYLDRYYDPDGDLRIPVVTLHTTRDPIVPFQQEAAFASRVAAHGATALLTQQSVQRYGHCAFAIGEMTNAFRTLVSQVSNGGHGH